LLSSSDEALPYSPTDVSGSSNDSISLIVPRSFHSMVDANPFCPLRPSGDRWLDRYRQAAEEDSLSLSQPIARSWYDPLMSRNERGVSERYLPPNIRILRSNDHNETPDRTLFGHGTKTNQSRADSSDRKQIPLARN
jgi:hypothetical protein